MLFKSSKADFTIHASDDIYYPDISICAGEDVSYPDLTFKVEKSGTVDYIVYTEKSYISLNEIVIALLPAINQNTKWEHEVLKKLFDK